MLIQKNRVFLKLVCVSKPLLKKHKPFLIFQIKESFSNKRSTTSMTNPYDQGSVISNFGNVLCTSIPPSVINLREIIPVKFMNDQSGKAYKNNMGFSDPNQLSNNQVRVQPKGNVFNNSSNLYNSKKISVSYSKQKSNATNNFGDIKMIE